MHVDGKGLQVSIYLPERQPVPPSSHVARRYVYINSFFYWTKGGCWMFFPLKKRGEKNYSLSAFVNVLNHGL